MKWTEKFRINSHDCDPVGRVRPSLILRYMQETAGLQLYNLGPSNAELAERDMAFILSRIGIYIYGTLHAYDEITVSTWASPGRGVSFNRGYEIRRGEELIAEASSIWGLIGISDRKIYRADDIAFGFAPGTSVEPTTPMRVHIPKDMPLSLVGERTVAYSDLDANNHMNNTNYPDMLCDFIPDIESEHINSVNISFVSDAKRGEILKVYTAYEDGKYYFRTVRRDGSVNVEAILGIE